MNICTFSNRLVAVTLGLAVVGIGAQSAFAADVWSESLVGVTNHVVSGYIDALDFSYNGDSSVSSSSINQSFTGLNQNNVSQTMNFTGTNWAQSNFGRLHCYASGSFTNTYYNASNPLYYNSDTNVVNPDGSPDGVASLGFAGFNDTLHYGGTLQAGYQARYIFHVDGTNSGDGGAADMGVSIAGNAGESFFAFGQGSYDENWVTQTYSVNGVDPQTISVQFSNQVTAESWDVPDGTNFSGISDFSSTLTLAGIEMLDANGNQVSGWTVTSDSGTQYASVPEPTSVAAIAIGAIGFIARRRKQA